MSFVDNLIQIVLCLFLFYLIYHSKKLKSDLNNRVKDLEEFANWAIENISIGKIPGNIECLKKSFSESSKELSAKIDALETKIKVIEGAEGFAAKKSSFEAISVIGRKF